MSSSSGCAFFEKSSGSFLVLCFLGTGTGINTGVWLLTSCCKTLGFSSDGSDCEETRGAGTGTTGCCTTSGSTGTTISGFSCGAASDSRDKGVHIIGASFTSSTSGCEAITGIFSFFSSSSTTSLLGRSFLSLSCTLVGVSFGWT